MTGEFRRATGQFALRKGAAHTNIFIRNGELLDHGNFVVN